MAGSELAAAYRLNAANCVEMAKAFPEPDKKLVLLNMANAWCGQYSLVAQEIRVVFVIDGMDFACVPPPA